jgi:hypothetical protein
VKPLYVHQSRFNTEDAGISLATRFLMDHLPEHLKDVGKTICTIHFDPSWSELQMNLYGTWMCYYMLFSNNFVQLNSELANSTKTFFDRSIDELIENQSTVDRITELSQVIDRG